MLEIKCIIHAVVNSLVRSAFLSLVWHMHGVCLLHGHVGAFKPLRLKSWNLDLRLSGKQIIRLCHDVIHDRASGVLRVV